MTSNAQYACWCANPSPDTPSHIKRKHDKEVQSLKPQKVLPAMRTSQEVEDSPTSSRQSQQTTQLPDQISSQDVFPCIACGRVCRSKAGLKSHQRNVQCQSILDTMETSTSMDS
uniref:C2H2-type domain-containing protein n=1 Tax=Cacopsylla melanoneura TaxID=428564 RepID=A0A8D8W7B4_9HEMI